MPYLTEKQKQNFWSKVNVKGPNDCWEWTACLKQGNYGRFGLCGKIELAHRVAFIDIYGMQNIKNCVLHKCDNPRCCNPNHLFEGTIQDNNQDMIKKGRGNQGIRKLNSEAVKVIRWMLKNKPQRGLATKLARLYNINKTTINQIKANKTWRNIKI